jgi:hypothetical protein
LYQKYIHASLNLSGARNDGNDGRYLDGNLHQIAGHIFRARDLRAKLTPLLEQAKAERDAAFAVTTAPKGKTKPAA